MAEKELGEYLVKFHDGSELNVQAEDYAQMASKVIKHAEIGSLLVVEVWVLCKKVGL